MLRFALSLVLIVVCSSCVLAQFVRISVTAFRPSTVRVPIHGVAGGSPRDSDLDAPTVLLCVGILGVAAILWVDQRNKRAGAAQPLPTIVAGKIVITSVPIGEAPLDIRAAWVGLELPVKNREPISVSGEGVITRSTMSAEWGYVVDAPAALHLLMAHHHDAAKWWLTTRGELCRSGAEFVFRDVECTKIE
jgi:hypothetical protein